MKKWCFLLLLLLLAGNIVACEEADGGGEGGPRWLEDTLWERGKLTDYNQEIRYKYQGVLYDEYIPDLVELGTASTSKKADTEYMCSKAYLEGTVYSLPQCENSVIVKGTNGVYYFLQNHDSGNPNYDGLYCGYLDDFSYKEGAQTRSGQHILIEVIEATDETVMGTVVKTGQGFTAGEIIHGRYHIRTDGINYDDVRQINVDKTEVKPGDLLILGMDVTDPEEKEGEILIGFIRAPEEE